MDKKAELVIELLEYDKKWIILHHHKENIS